MSEEPQEPGDGADDDLISPPEDPRAYRLKIWLGIGLPSLLAGLVAVGLGIPWWIVLIFLALVAVGIVFNT